MKLLRDVVKKRSTALTAEDTDQLNQYRDITIGRRMVPPATMTYEEWADLAVTDPNPPPPPQYVYMPARLEQRMCTWCLAITIYAAGSISPSIHRPGCIHELVRTTNETT